MSAPSRTTKKDDVEALLSDLDNLDPTSGSGSGGGVTSAVHSTKADDAQSLLDDLDDLVKRRAPTPKKPSLFTPSTSHTPTNRSTPTNRTNNSTPLPTNTLTVDGGLSSTIAAGSSEPLEETTLSSLTNIESLANTGAASDQTTSQSQPSWGNWWSSATKLADQARAELEKRAAMVQSQVVETAREVGEGAGNPSTSSPASVPWAIAQNVNSFLKNNRDLNKLKSDFSKVGKKGWNELLNVVVPPIEQHEILSITLSHDMVGYDGISDVVFTVLQRVMEAHASSHSSEHQLIVNKAPERTSLSDDKSTDADKIGRYMKPVTGLEQGWKLAETKLSQLIDSTSEERKKESSSNDNSISLPITTCPLYIRIQPVLDFMPGLSNSSLTHSSPTHLFLQILLEDPINSLLHKTISQPIPKTFIDLNFEEYGWVEELLSDSLQGALGAIALEYIQGRNLGTSLRTDVVEAASAAAAPTAEAPP